MVKGLLGKGKERVVFEIEMNLETSRVYLNLEDGSPLAMLQQERIAMDIKVSHYSLQIGPVLARFLLCAPLIL